MSSRVARKPIPLPGGVDVKINGTEVTVKGAKGELKYVVHPDVAVSVQDQAINVKAIEGAVLGEAIAGTMRAILNNCVRGVTEGFVRKLQLVGVGYRAQVGKAKDGRPMLSLTLGLSHPVTYIAPAGIQLAAPTVTDIEVSGLDYQLVGQTAADIRGICGGIRKPEPYKGKGIRYADEVIVLKETKKK